MQSILAPRKAALSASTAFVLTTLFSAPDVDAQQSIVFAFSGNVFNLDGGSGLVNAGRIRPDEVGVVTPISGTPYSARTLIGSGTQWAWRGDDDNDSDLVDSPTAAPGSDTDALMVKRFMASGTLTERDLCISKEDNYSTTNGFLDGDVYYHPSQGVVRTFITEAQVAAVTGATSVDVDAICQDTNGDLYLSFDLDETTSAGPAENSSIVRVPAAAITYDANGDVSGVVGGLVEVLNTENDLDTFILNSGLRSNGAGVPFNSTNDISGLEIDPNGGTWVSPVNGLTYPNLLLTWDSGSSNDGGIISTAGGGSIAVINGVPMGSPVATTGQHLGLLPQSTGQSDAFALALLDNFEFPITLENYPESQLTGSDFGFSRQEVSGATPFSPVAFVLSIGPSGPGTALNSIAFPGIVNGEFYEPSTAIVATSSLTDARGYAEQTLNIAVLVGSATNICWQVYDFGQNRLSLPAPIQF